MSLKQPKKELNKIFYYLIKINECKLLIYENTRLSKKYQKDKNILEEKILNNTNHLRDLKCKLLSYNIEIECIEKELQESASVIIQYYLRNYFLKHRINKLSENILNKRYIIRKNYVENNKEYRIYLKQLKNFLIEVEEQIIQYSDIENKSKHDQLKKELNKQIYFEKLRKEQSERYFQNIPKYKKLIMDKFILLTPRLTKLSSLNRMELNQFIHCLEDNKTKYCTLQLEIVLRKLLADSLYDHNVLFTFLNKE